MWPNCCKDAQIRFIKYEWLAKYINIRQDAEKKKSRSKSVTADRQKKPLKKNNNVYVECQLGYSCKV